MGLRRENAGGRELLRRTLAMVSLAALAGVAIYALYSLLMKGWQA